MSICVEMSGERRTSDLNITGLRPPVAKRHTLGAVGE